MQEQQAAGLPGALAKAAEKSSRIMAEDLLREAGYMLPQSGNARALLTEMLAQFSEEPGFPAEDARFLLDTISFNEPTTPKEDKTMEVWKCTVPCGEII